MTVHPSNSESETYVWGNNPIKSVKDLKSTVRPEIFSTKIYRPCIYAVPDSSRMWGLYI